MAQVPRATKFPLSDSLDPLLNEVVRFPTFLMNGIVLFAPPTWLLAIRVLARLFVVPRQALLKEQQVESPLVLPGLIRTLKSSRLDRSLPRTSVANAMTVVGRLVLGCAMMFALETIVGLEEAYRTAALFVVAAGNLTPPMMDLGTDVESLVPTPLTRRVLAAASARSF